MQEPLDPIDKYMLGAVNFAILSRSRWSDLKFIDQIWIDKMEYKGELYGFVEACTKHHKTATTLTKKQLYMPLVAPVLGVTTVDWTKHWVQACDSLGVDFQVQPFGALCRAASHGGVLCKRPCTTEEIGTFLNRILKTNVENAITSHSLKHTTLSWCAAYGLDEPSRTLLGHHELQGAKAMTVYSRDLLTRPLQLYCSMLSNIRLDHFRPDVSRPSRMVDLLKIAEKATEPGHQMQMEFVDPKKWQQQSQVRRLLNLPRLWTQLLGRKMRRGLTMRLQVRFHLLGPVLLTVRRKVRQKVQIHWACILRARSGGTEKATWCTSALS